MRKRGVFLICGILFAVGIILIALSLVNPVNDNPIGYRSEDSGGIYNYRVELSNCKIVIMKHSNPSETVIDNPPGKLIRSMYSGGNLEISDDLSFNEIITSNIFSLGYKGLARRLYASFKKELPTVTIKISDLDTLSLIDLSVRKCELIIDGDLCDRLNLDAEGCNVSINGSIPKSTFANLENTDLEITTETYERDIRFDAELTDCRVTKNSLPYELSSSDKERAYLFSVFASSSKIDFIFPN